MLALVQDSQRLAKLRNKILICQIILIVLITVTLFAGSLSNGFVFDDNNQILRNKWITDTKYLPEIFSSNVAGFDKEYATNYYRPLMYVFYMVTYYLFGLNATGFHLVNIFFHCCISILVFLITSRVFRSHIQFTSRSFISLPFMSAILFVSHPIHTEAVAWIAALPELTFAFFYLFSFYLYIILTDSKEGGKPFILIISAFLFFAATLCKESALTLPITLAIYDYLFRRGTFDKLENFKLYIPYFAVVIFYFFIRFSALEGFVPTIKHKLGLYQTIINIFVLFAEYVQKAIYPAKLSAFYIFNPASSLFEKKAMVSLIVVVVVVTFCIAAFYRNKHVFWGFSLFIVSILPAMYIPGLGENAFADRQLYLPSFGFVILLSIFLFWLQNSIIKSKIAVTIIFLSLTGLYSVLTVDRIGVWKDEYSLWKDVITKSPESATVQRSFGYALYLKGRINDAIEHYSLSLKLDPRNLDAHNNLGVAYHVQNQIDKAIGEYKIALGLNPNSIDVRLNLGQAYMENMLSDKAIEQFHLVLKLDPNSARAYELLGTTYGNAGFYDEAIKCFEIALRLNPNNQATKENLAKAHHLKRHQPHQ